MAGWHALTFRQIDFDEHWEIEGDSTTNAVVIYTKEKDEEAAFELRSSTGASTRVSYGSGEGATVRVSGNVVHFRKSKLPSDD